MFMSPALTNQHRVTTENVGLPLNALNGSDQGFDMGPPPYEDAISPPLFSPMSFSSMGSPMMTSPTFPRQKTNSVSPMNSPTQERQIGGRKYGVPTLADTYHVTNSDDFGIQTHHFFGEHLRPGECPPPYEPVFAPCDVSSETNEQHVREETTLRTCSVNTDTCTVNTDTCSVGPGSIRIISHSSTVGTASVASAPIQQKQKQRNRRKRMRHVICGISAVVTAIAVPTLIYFITTSTHDQQTAMDNGVITTVSPSSSTTPKNTSRNRRHILSILPSWFGKKAKLNVDGRELAVSVMKEEDV